MKKLINLIFYLCSIRPLSAQQKPKLEIRGIAGINYQGYGLNRNPSGWAGYSPRRSWNQVRFNFKFLEAPLIK